MVTKSAQETKTGTFTISGVSANAITYKAVPRLPGQESEGSYRGEFSDVLTIASQARRLGYGMVYGDADNKLGSKIEADFRKVLSDEK